MDEESAAAKQWVVYCLATEDYSATYVGATVDRDRRLRQHNGLIKGGARATGARVAAGYTWNRICHVSGFPDNHAALQFEWRWKSLCRRKDILGKPVTRRMKALKILLGLDRPTSQAALYTTYGGGGPEVVWEDDLCQQEFNQIQ